MLAVSQAVEVLRERFPSVPLRRLVAAAETLLAAGWFNEEAPPPQEVERDFDPATGESLWPQEV